MAASLNLCRTTLSIKIVQFPQTICCDERQQQRKTVVYIHMLNIIQPPCVCYVLHCYCTRLLTTCLAIVRPTTTDCICAPSQLCPGGGGVGVTMGLGREILMSSRGSRRTLALVNIWKDSSFQTTEWSVYSACACTNDVHRLYRPRC